MTHQKDYSFADELAGNGLDTILELVCVLINNAIRKISLDWQVNELIKSGGHFRH